MLTLKHLPISSFNENIVYLHKDCVAYKLEDIKFMTNKTKNLTRILCIFLAALMILGVATYVFAFLLG